MLVNTKKIRYKAPLNVVKLSGIITEKLTKVKSFGDCFYDTKIKIERELGIVDELPIRINSNILSDIGRDLKGKCVKIDGNICSYNEKDSADKRHLKVYVLVKRLEVIQTDNENHVHLKAHICEEVYLFREKSKDGTSILRANILLNIKRSSKKSSFIPCVAYNENAIKLKKLHIGSEIEIKGKFTSREYETKSGEKRTVYEVIINTIE